MPIRTRGILALAAAIVAAAIASTPAKAYPPKDVEDGSRNSPDHRVTDVITPVSPVSLRAAEPMTIIIIEPAPPRPPRIEVPGPRLTHEIAQAAENYLVRRLEADNDFDDQGVSSKGRILRSNISSCAIPI